MSNGINLKALMQPKILIYFTKEGVLVNKLLIGRNIQYIKKKMNN